MNLAAVVAAALVAAPAATDVESFRWERSLTAPQAGFGTFEPDGPLYAHSRLGLADLRVRDSRGRQVPWRFLPLRAETNAVEAALLNAGRRGRGFDALVDLGPRRVIRNRLELDFATNDYVGRVTVFGSDDRRTFTRLSTTTVYDIRGGASAATSNTIVFPATDQRFLRLRGERLPTPVAVRAYNVPRRPRLQPVPAELAVSERRATSVAVVDVGYARRPVDALRFSTTTPRFEREVEIFGSNGGRAVPLGFGRIVSLGGVSHRQIGVTGRHRRLRVVVHNADDAPLRALRVQPLALRRTVVLERGFVPPYRVLYGSRLAPPQYDFENLPPRELRPLVAVRLGAERPNPDWQPPEDTRSFLERNPRLVEVALALVAIGLGLGGLLALRRRA